MSGCGRIRKVLQRRLFTCLGTTPGAMLGLLSLLVLFSSVTRLLSEVTRLMSNSGAACRSSADNIAERDFSHVFCPEPIDVVYTWVNGSDPNWLAAMEHFREQDKKARAAPGESSSADEQLQVLLGNGSAPAGAAANSSSEENDHPADTVSINRFRDSDELRFSLRSLEKYAPWIRRVYLVTNGQVPSWLNLDDPRVSVVPHEDIFPDPEVLPVFSSPAIEVHIHRVPGLSRRFIYFNDDVFLGRETWPEDFYTRAHGQKVYLSWGVPKCSPGCMDAWIGDGYCDQACNTERCAWDAGDCEGIPPRRGHGVMHGDGAMMTLSATPCADGCPSSWLADMVCDPACEVPQCGYDAGDCGVSALRSEIPHAGIDRSGILKALEHRQALQPGVAPSRVNGTSVRSAVSVELSPVQLPAGEPAVYVNLSTVIDTLLRAGPDGDPSLPGAGDALVNETVRWSATAASHGFAPWLRAVLFVEHVPMVLFVLDPKPQLDGGLPEGEEDMVDDLLLFEDEYHPSTELLADDIPPEMLDDVVGYEEEGAYRRRLAVESPSARPPLPTESAESPGDTSDTAAAASSLPSASPSPFPFTEGDESHHRTVASLPVRLSFLLMDTWRASVHFNVTMVLPVPQQEQRPRPTAAKPGRRRRLQQQQQHKQQVPMVRTDWPMRMAGSRELPRPSARKGAHFIQKQPKNGSPLHTVHLMRRAWARLLGVAQGEESGLRGHRRRRLDTFGDSLVHTNQMISDVFGRKSRSVPAHMPHMIDREAMESLQRQFPEEFEKTAAHRFRRPDDIQFAFAYFYWIMEGGAQEGLDMDRYWRQELDTDGDGVLSENEFRTLAAIVINGSPSKEDLGALRQCISGDDESHGTALREENVPVRDVTLDKMMQCGMATDGLSKHARFSPTFETGNVEEVAFEMITDDANVTLAKLDSIRARRTKFICLNDDMHEGPARVQAMLRDFLVAYYPTPSRFELPEGKTNQYLYWQDARRIIFMFKVLRWVTGIGILLVVSAVVAAFVRRSVLSRTLLPEMDPSHCRVE